MDWRLWRSGGNELPELGGQIRCDPGAEPRALATQLRAEFDRLVTECGLQLGRRWRLHWAWNGGSAGLRELLQVLPCRWRPVRVCGPGPELLVKEVLSGHAEISAHDGLCFVWNSTVHAVLGEEGELLHRSRKSAGEADPIGPHEQQWLRQTAALWKCKTGLEVGRWWSLDELRLKDSVDELMHRSLVQPATSNDRHQPVIRQIRKDEARRRSQSHLQRGLGMVLLAAALSGLAACRSSDTAGGSETQERWGGMQRDIKSYDAQHSEQMLNDQLTHAASHALPELFNTLPIGLQLRSARYHTDAATVGRRPRGVWRIQGIALSKEQMPTLENWTETISLRPGVGQVTAVNISQMENLIQFKIETEVLP